MPGDRTHRDVKANGVRLRVTECGTGPALVLLHGMFVDHRTWDGVVEDLSTEFRVVAPDFPGFGESEKPSAQRFRYDVDAFAEVVADLYAGLDLGRAAVLGHGLGGGVAIALAARHPELVSRLVLVDSMCFEAPLDLRRKIALLPVVGGFVFKQLWNRATFRAYFREVVVSDGGELPRGKVDGYYDAFNGPQSRGSALSTLRATVDTRPVLAMTARISAPTLVVWGREDRVFPAALGQRLARQIRGAGFELMNAGHAPHEERPREFSEIVSRFLRAERPAGT
ncbi:MAG TPA: alpha/beta hydrolase [Polyangiaceae bacterium]|jgi:pimeloyl-ACP methyl ester carboxylesterase|nr:alpha/beta hydrolase [Polyangiaceae bacterium]